MTIIEFFDEDPIENVVSQIVCRPDRIIYLGEKRQMERGKPGLLRYLQRTAPEVGTEFRSISRNDVPGLIRLFTELAETCEDCVFDLTGGDDAVLFAMGAVYSRITERGGRVRKFNVRTGRPADLGLGPEPEALPLPRMTVEDAILLHGGSVIPETGPDGAPLSWDLSEAFTRDLAAMWEVCRANCGQWNAQTAMLGTLSRFDRDPDPMTLEFSVPDAERALSVRGHGLDLGGIFPGLMRAGILTDLSMRGDLLHLRFKSEQVRRCLSKAGNLLELMTYQAGLNLTKKGGEKLYHDAMTGVRIDWDGTRAGSSDADVENEIDVILMAGLVPVFISCKNGGVEEEELYKLHTVASRFGGRYARKVLLCTDTGRGPKSLKVFRARAAEMGIQVIGGVHTLSAGDFPKALRRIQL